MKRWLDLSQRTHKKNPARLKAVNLIIGHANNIKRERDDFVHGNFGSSGIFFKMRDGQVVEISDTTGSPPHIEDLACRISDVSAELTRHHLALRKHYRKWHG